MRVDRLASLARKVFCPTPDEVAGLHQRLAHLGEEEYEVVRTRPSNRPDQDVVVLRCGGLAPRSGWAPRGSFKVGEKVWNDDPRFIS